MKQRNDPSMITTPDKVESRIGTLQFTDEMPSQATLGRACDRLDFTHALKAFVNAIQGVNTHTQSKGSLDVGVNDSEVILFSERGPDSTLTPPSQVLRLQRPEQ